ncbi:hypothetical protein ALO61_200037 [Pseudomonas savastanoi pv. nerii]|nr:hypothetical protein ALO61_200037 [Pseudomonas savastanoi pv. nerii]
MFPNGQFYGHLLVPNLSTVERSRQESGGTTGQQKQIARNNASSRLTVLPLRIFRRSSR